MDKLLEVKNLQISFLNKNKVSTPVENISFSIEKGQTMALVGESGSGKSLTALSIVGLLNSWDNDHQVSLSGDILYRLPDNQVVNLNNMSDPQLDKVRGQSIGFIFQEPHSAFNPVVSVGNQIAEMLIIHKKMTKKAARKRVVELLDLVGIPQSASRFDSYPHQFSGGQLQRVMIAMAISCNPDLLIADEPTTALDVTVQKQILDLLKNLQKEFNMGILMITHDLGVVSEFADKISVMYSGNVLESGRIDKVFAQAKHPYTELLLQSVLTMETDFEKRLLTRDDFISPEGKAKGSVLFDPYNRQPYPLEWVEEKHAVSKMFTKEVV